MAIEVTARTWEVVCLALLLYIYIGYPALCWLLGKVRPRRVHKDPDQRPMVSILIAAHDEAAVIGETVRNKLALDYPSDRLEVIVVSDASTDGTDAVVEAIAAAAEGRVRLLRQEPRAGKTAALNLAVREALGEVYVFADANSLYAPDALQHLVAPLADPDVGYVTGRMLYRAPDGSLSGEGCSKYMRYENTLRRLESNIGSLVGVDGGIDAVKASLYRSMRPDLQSDFVLPLSVVENGYRVVFADGARLYEDALDRSGDEFRMRVRVILRAWHALWFHRSLLVPWHNALYCWQLWSHKVLRYLAPLPLLGLLGAGFVTMQAGGVWVLLMAGQLLFYGGALLGALWPSSRRPRLLVVPFYFTLINAAALVALGRFLAGQRQATWQPRT